MKNLRYQFALLACLASAALSSRALSQQDAANANGTPVHMIVTVEPRKGSDLAVVNREDVMVYERKNWRVADISGEHCNVVCQREQ